MLYKIIIFMAVIILCNSGCSSLFTSPESSPSPTGSSSTDSLVTVGEVENIYLDNFEMPFEARIDSGAQTSSIDASKITPFERDGEPWIEFNITNRTSKQTVTLSQKIVRKVKIKGDNQERYVVNLKIKVGSHYIKREFTLANRKTYKYPVLIGRNVLSGIALIDVSQKKLLN